MSSPVVNPAPAARAFRQRNFRARMAEIQEVMALMTETFTAASAPPPDEALLFDLRLTVTEAFANIVEHSYGNEPDCVIRVEFELAPSWLEIRFADFGRRPEPHRLRWRELGDYRERGLGLFLMSKCMDEVEFSFQADGMNRLRTRRLLARSGTQKPGAHLPFHVAVYESELKRQVHLIGHLDQTRPDPFAGLALAAGETISLELGSLDYIDAFGLDKIESLAARCRQAACHLRLTPPPEHLSGLFNERGLMALMRDETRSAPAVETRPEDPRRPTARYLPLFRTFGSYFFPGAPSMLPDEAGDPDDLLAAFAPSRLAVGSFRACLSLRRGARTRALFVRALRPECGEAEVLLFVGRYARPGIRALIGAAQLHAALGAYPAFGRTRPTATLHDFVRLLSSGMRDLLPSATADPDGDALHLVVLEFSADGLRAVTGVGPVLVEIDGLELRAIALAASENAIVETRDLKYFTGTAMPFAARLLLGEAALESQRRRTAAAAAEFSGSGSTPPETAGDEGVLDVVFG